ncbi:MAG: pyruvate, water dikinase regulatory protein [Pseudomonadota bacterium]
MNRRTVFFVSDQTGITAETLGHSLLTQFEGIKFKQITVPFISDVDKASEVVQRINLTAQVEGYKPIVFSTFVQNDLREIMAGCNGVFMDFFDAFIGPLERSLEMKSTHTTGKAHGRADSEAYTRRIDAMNFAVANDDGVTTRNYDRADIVLLGVSRSGKTPTCLYLALHYGIFAANYPLTEDELDKRSLPASLQDYRNKLYGLTIEPDRLQQIRGERKPDSRYASAQQVGFELRAAEAMYQSNAIPYINTTKSSIEEIASQIIHERRIKRGNSGHGD